MVLRLHTLKTRLVVIALNYPLRKEKKIWRNERKAGVQCTTRPQLEQLCNTFPTTTTTGLWLLSKLCRSQPSVMPHALILTLALKNSFLNARVSLLHRTPQHKSRTSPGPSRLVTTREAAGDRPHLGFSSMLPWEKKIRPKDSPRVQERRPQSRRRRAALTRSPPGGGGGRWEKESDPEHECPDLAHATPRRSCCCCCPPLTCLPLQPVAEKAQLCRVQHSRGLLAELDEGLQLVHLPQVHGGSRAASLRRPTPPAPSFRKELTKTSSLARSLARSGPRCHAQGRSTPFSSSSLPPSVRFPSLAGARLPLRPVPSWLGGLPHTRRRCPSYCLARLASPASLPAPVAPSSARGTRIF